MLLTLFIAKNIHGHNIIVTFYIHECFAKGGCAKGGSGTDGELFGPGAGARAPGDATCDDFVAHGALVDWIIPDG